MHGVLKLGNSMTHKNRNFEQRLEFAKQFEKAVAAWLQRRGWLVLPTYDFSGKDDDKAPKLMAQQWSKSLIVPDLLACRGETHWVEVKYKTHAEWTWMTQRYETGLNLRLWDHYREVWRVSGIKIWIVFVHRDEAEMRCGDIEYLNKLRRVYRGDKMSPGGTIFFPWEKLHRLAGLDEVLQASGDDFGGKNQAITSSC